MKKHINEKLLPLIEHFVSASKCTDCFTKGLASNTRVVSGGQPRRVGSDYFETQNKVCFVLLNPSGAETLKETVWDEHMQRLSSEEYGSEQAWKEFQEFFDTDEENWGKGRPWPKLYYDATGLLKSEVAFVNAMLCADDEDSYPPEAITNCLLHQKKSLRAIQLLDPSMVVLSSTETINAFLKKEKKTTLSELRKKRESYVKRLDDANKKGELTQKHLESVSYQKLLKSDIKKEIIDALPNAEFFWMGHYAAWGSDNEDDAAHFKCLLEIRNILSQT